MDARCQAPFPPSHSKAGTVFGGRRVTFLSTSPSLSAGRQPVPWLERAPPSSAPKTAAIFNHNRVHLSTLPPFLASSSVPVSLFQPSLFVVGGVLIFHPTSNQHIEGLAGRPVGGRREHAALAVVLFQAADKLTTFIFPGMMKTSVKKFFFK